MNRVNKTLIGILLLLIIAKYIPGIPVSVNTAVSLNVPSAITPYIKRFYKDAHRINPSIRAYYVPISFIDTNDDVVIGTCYQIHPVNYITISRSYWLESTDTERELLIYHELGHCVLGKHHSSYGIMRAYLMSPGVYEARRETYLRNLFDMRPQVLDDYADE